MRKIRFLSEGIGEIVEEAVAPVAGPGRLLVRTEAVGVGLGLLRALSAGLAQTGEPGGEMVGRVVAVGEGVAGFAVGDRVGGVVLGGAFAELVVAVPALVSAVPEEVDAGAALALVRGGLIALSVLRAGRFEAGESVLITGAASGVGHLAVQLARAAGASRVVAAAGSAAKADFLRGCRADDVVVYAQPSWADPVDLVLDGVGGEMVQRGVNALAAHGRLVAFSAGGGSVDTGSLLADLKTVTGFSIGLVSRQSPDLITQRRAELWSLLAARRLHPAWTAFPLEKIGDAIELIRTRANLGRVLLHLPWPSSL
jgi:NADPH:quinone reductase-like Zn-dependent oxidoreductase